MGSFSWKSKLKEILYSIEESFRIMSKIKYIHKLVEEYELKYKLFKHSDDLILFTILLFVI